MLIASIRFIHKAYKTCLSPFLGNRCRFEPSCSDYALEALETRGLIIGTALGLIRIVKCNPLFKGGYDPVPQRKEF